MLSIPSVGSIVSVTTRYRNIYIFSDAKTMDINHIGEVVKNDKWIPADNFSVQTGNKNHPVSIISVKNVVDIQYLSKKDKDISVRKFKVKGKSEHLVLFSNNHFSCDCIGFKYRMKCKHIEAVKRKII